MKVAAFATALLALVASSSQLTLAEEPLELWVAILGYKSKDALINATLKMVTSDEPPESEDIPEEVIKWASNCMQGSYTSTPPEDPMSEEDFNPADWGIDMKDFAHLQSEDFDWSNKKDQDLYKKLVSKMLDKVKYEYKLFWLTDAETMKKAECKQSAVAGALNSSPFMADIFKVIKYEKVNLNAEQLKSCVKTEVNSEGQTVPTQPLCGNSPTSWSEPSEDEDKCVACAISNSVIASTMVVGAMMAASFFF